MSSLLGDDGLGYDLARRLEDCGVWRPWLGDSIYPTFLHSLSSPSAWEAFMRADPSMSRAHIQLQLRARALLFDKASVSLFLRSSPSSSSAPDASKLNPAYLQLHGDDVYYTLENSLQDGHLAPDSAPSKSMQIKAKAAFSAGSRYGELDADIISQRLRHEDLSESWYSQFIEKYRASKPYRLLFGDREIEKRTPEQMLAYLRHLEKYKRRRVAFKEDQCTGSKNLILENKSSIHLNADDDDAPFFPETMYTFNCVPDTALSPITRVEEKKKMKFYGVFDTLPKVVSKCPIMIERLGIRPENLTIEQAGNLYRGKQGFEGNKKQLGQEQASSVSKKVVAHMLINVGFEGSSEVPIEVVSQLLSCHIHKLGHILKVLADNYRKQCSAIELLKMFLQTAGYSNLGALAEHVKDSTQNMAQQIQQTQQAQHAQQQIQGIQSQVQPQHQSSVQQSQQIQRQVHPQMSQSQMLHPQNSVYQQQQQWDRMQRRQGSTPRPEMSIEKDRPLVEVKLENTELPMDANMAGINKRQPQMQLRQQQMAALSNFHGHQGNQFRQMASLQVSQTSTMSTVRAPPVKVEGFQELMGGGGDASLKHDLAENKLTSPHK